MTRPLTVALLLLPALAFAGDPWADEVVSVTWGDGAGFGQDAFPANVLGPPDPSAGETVPANSPEELLTLGSGGEIVLAFRDGGIEDGSGTDFTVFENVFLAGGLTPYTETAFVAVSEDGSTWHEFPWDGNTLAGLAGVSPTFGDADPTDPNVSGGDSFDLSELGLQHAVYVRLTDTGGLVDDSGPSFDLDSVVAIHGETTTHAPIQPAQLPNDITLRAWPNPFNASVTIELPPGIKTLVISDALGRQLDRLEIRGGRALWDSEGTPSGVYLLHAAGSSVPPLRLVKVR